MTSLRGEGITPSSIKTIRELMGLTRKDLASALSISRTTLQAMEEGRKPITDKVEKMVLELFEKEDIPSRKPSLISVDHGYWELSPFQTVPAVRRREVEQSRPEGDRYRGKTHEILGRGW